MFIRFENVEFFALILVRVTTFIMLMPALGYSQIPPRVKITLGLVITLLLIPTIPYDASLIVGRTIWHYTGLVFEQIAIGVTLGFVANFIFMAIQLAGQVVGMQMGFGIVNTIDPESQLQVSIIGQLKNMFFLVIFLILDGHLLLLKVLGETFQQVPVGGLIFADSLVGQVVGMSAEVFVWAIQLGAPVIASLFLTEVALGIVSRTVPQMNIFIVGFPLKIGMGFWLLLAAIPLMVVLFKGMLGDVLLNLHAVLQAMH